MGQGVLFHILACRESQGSTQVYCMLSLTIRCTSVKRSETSQNMYSSPQEGGVEGL